MVGEHLPDEQAKLEPHRRSFEGCAGAAAQTHRHPGHAPQDAALRHVAHVNRHEQHRAQGGRPRQHHGHPLFLSLSIVLFLNKRVVEAAELALKNVYKRPNGKGQAPSIFEDAQGAEGRVASTWASASRRTRASRAARSRV
jgi:hypothetical protein